jgi:serine/threonine protein kinase
MPEMIETKNPAALALREEQLRRWEHGDPVRLEVLLATRGDLSGDTDAILDLIYSEVLLREEHGERPAEQEYLRRFPQLTEALRRLFAVHEGLASLDTDKPQANASAATQTDPGHSRQRAMPTLAWACHPTGHTGPYEILEEIGRGGMGIVYKARHPVTGRLAALKVIRPDDTIQEGRTRFLTEAKAVAALSHPNIVQVYEVFAPPPGEGMPSVALEYIAGGNLASHINGTPLPAREAAALLLPLAGAMAHAHQAGIVHRDLKPANILLASGGRATDDGSGTTHHSPFTTHHPKITDFGLAKELDTSSAQTRTGAVLGTPCYMAPEQASGHSGQSGPAVDIYALGAILYEMLTGRPPFKGSTVLETLDQVRHQEPVTPRQLNPAVPRDLETVCLKCLHKDPARRYASSRELADDLQRYLNGEPVRARPVGRWERALKWMKRRPAATALLGVTALALAALVAVWVSFTIRLEEQRHQAITQRDLKEEQAKIAQRQSAEARKQSERAAHLLALTAAAVDDIAINVRGSKVGEAGSGKTGSVLFKLASFYAMTSTSLATDQVLPPEDRQRLAEQYAVSAVRLLNCAEQVGFFDPAQPENRQALDSDPNLVVLHDRADYKKFRERLR